MSTSDLTAADTVADADVFRHGPGSNNPDRYHDAQGAREVSCVHMHSMYPAMIEPVSFCRPISKVGSYTRIITGSSS